MIRLFALLCFALPAHASLINGSFERGVDLDEGFATINDYASIPGWIADPAIDYVGDAWQSSDGNRSIDLSANDPGAMHQHVATTPGQTYIVRFDMAGNPVAGPAIKTMNVSANGAAQNYFFDTTGRTLMDMGWEPRLFIFTALEESVLLSFKSLTDTSFGPAIDNVRFAVIPTPPAILLLGTALLFGVGFIARGK